MSLPAFEISRPSDALPLHLRLPVMRIFIFALRELRSGISGFGIFIACIALGVTLITGVGSLASAFLSGFERQGRELLGGDVSLRRVHKRATAQERMVFAKLGRVSELATMRSMARLPNGEDQALVEIKAVDDVYPLIGTFELANSTTLTRAIREQNGAVVAQSLLDRLNIKVGDSFRLGTREIVITGVIAREPDRIGARIAFGPRVVMSYATLASTGLVQPGTLISWQYAIVAPDGASDPQGAVGRIRQMLGEKLSEAGFIITDRSDPSPTISRQLNRMRDFLTLLGLAALLIGGVGVANAVRTFVDRRRKVIATYKSVGATSGTVFGIYMMQIMIIAAFGTCIGLLIGNLLPLILAAIYGPVFEIELGPSFTWTNTAIGLGYGFLVTLLFILWPLGQTERIRPAALFRDEVAGSDSMPRLRILFLIAIIGGLLLALVTFTSRAPMLALWFLGGMLAILFLFWMIGYAITWLAGRLPRPHNRPELTLSMVGIAAPGGLTRSVVLSLGAGLSLLVAVALVDESLVNELRGRMPEQSPDYFVLDIPKADRALFETSVLELAPGTKIETAPMLRGRISRLNGIPVENAQIDPRAAWVLRGDRGLTYAEEVPEGSKIVEGKWWDKGYKGEPQVSFASDLAEDLGLKVGDTVTVNVLGRNITARITNLREIEWESLAINFVMVFSPNALAAAPHNLLATVRFPDDIPATADAAVGRVIGRELPHISMIRVKDAINAFAEIFANVMVAVRTAASVTLIAGALVLAGALATAQRRRVLQAVVLKCIGATRRRLLLANLAEYGLLAFITSVIALVVGSIAAWGFATYLLQVDFVFSWRAVASAIATSVGLILVFGLFGTWRVLAAKPVPVLRGL
ncbi:MAG: FtsX-like permease family protein [Pseudomonadota bacterium]